MLCQTRPKTVNKMGRSPFYPRNTTRISKGVFCGTRSQSTGICGKYYLWASRTSNPSGRTSRYQSGFNTGPANSNATAFAQTGFGDLTDAKELLGDLYDYGQLRLFRAVHGKTGKKFPIPY
jgi:hypothetical protein